MWSKFKKLGLNPDNSIIIGSGILQALNIRRSKDVDVIVNLKTYENLKNSGKFSSKYILGQEVLKDELFEIGTVWNVLGKPYKFNDLVENSVVINGVRYISIDFLYKFKKGWMSKGEARPKDLKDIKLMERHFSKKTVIFVTKNKRKIGEARLACDKLGIKIVQERLDINEIQSHNPLEISKHKAEQAFAIIKKPLVVTDTFWNIPALNGFPGGYMKDISEWFSEEDFLNLMKDKKDRSIAFTETIAYKDSKRLKLFSKEYWGRIVEAPRGVGTSIENIAEFEGVTLGERRQQGGFSHRPEEYIWMDFARWFSQL